MPLSKDFKPFCTFCSYQVSELLRYVFQERLLRTLPQGLVQILVGLLTPKLKIPLLIVVIEQCLYNHNQPQNTRALSDRIVFVKHPLTGNSKQV